MRHPTQTTLRRSCLLALTCVAASLSLSAQQAPATAETASPAGKATLPSSEETIGQSDETITLSPFEVTADSDVGYLATQTLAGSRINSKLEDVGSAISVITAEFFKDTGATDNKTLLAYTVSTEVGGTQGNFRNSSGGQNQDESGSFTNPNGNTRVRGLTSADNTRGFFMSDIPWEGYNVERVDMQRGPNSILFGLGSPAGIINTTTKGAQHRNFGEFESRFGSHGSHREVLDANINVLKKQLSFRINLVRNEEKYQQEPAFSLDRRKFATLRYEPSALNQGGMKTSIKANYESGTIDSNNPRTITPTDLVTPWFSHLNKRAYDPSLVHYGNWFYNEDQTTYLRPDANEYNAAYASGVTLPSGWKNPYTHYLGAPQMYGGVWMSVLPGESDPFMTMLPEYRNINGVNSAGTRDSGIGGLPFTRRVTVASTAYWAERNTGAPYQSWGVWKSATLSDPKVFDFYNQLIDGSNKREYQKFYDMSVFLNQTFFGDRVGYEAAFDKQRARRGQYAFNGGGPLYIDINAKNVDGTPNANVGRPYVESSYFYGSGSSDVHRESSRFSAFANHDFNKGGTGGWVRKLLGRHTLSGLLSREGYWSDRRSFARFGTPDSFGPMFNTSADAYKLLNGDRNVTSTIYLGESLSGASLGDSFGISSPGKISVPSTASLRYFDSTWNSSVNPADVWRNTFNGQNSTQSENPANYVGWKTKDVQILSAENGDEIALTHGAVLDKRTTESKAIVMQSHFWDGLLVGMYGVRNDKVRSWAIQAAKEKYMVGSNTYFNDRVDFNALDAQGRLHYTTKGKPYDLQEANNPSWSIVAKLSKVLPSGFPLNINLYYNESSNFQVTGTRNDIYGRALAAPSGETKDRGILISTKNEMFSLRVNKYETRVLNASNTTGFPTWYLMAGDNFIMRSEDRADAYEQQLWELGNPSSASWTSGPWTWRYAPFNGQTQEQADAQSAAAVASWRAYTNEPVVKEILKAWGFNDFNITQRTSMSTPVANFVATEDQLSKGWEYEFTANPTKNWRISINAAETKASRTNIGGKDLVDFVELTNKYYQEGKIGDLRAWGGGGSSTLKNSWNSNFYSKYLLMKLQEGTFSSELRRWRFNLVTNYSFNSGKLKGLSVGGGYRWQDKVAIGYPVIQETATKVVFDIENPYYGPRLDAIDLWVGYGRKLTSKIDWRVQLNIRNLGDGNKLQPLSAQYDGTVAAWAIAPSQSWTITNTFKF